MSDEIKGVAVLHDTVPDQVLFVVCVPDPLLHPLTDGPFMQRLPVRPENCARTQEPQWQYRVEGAVLHCSPSVLCRTTRPRKDDPKLDEEIELFHNGYTWSVPFVRWSEISQNEVEDSRWTACYQRNTALLG